MTLACDWDRTDAQSPAGRVTVGVKSSPHAKDAKVDDSGAVGAMPAVYVCPIIFRCPCQQRAAACSQGSGSGLGLAQEAED